MARRWWSPAHGVSLELSQRGRVDARKSSINQVLGLDSNTACGCSCAAIGPHVLAFGPSACNQLCATGVNAAARVAGRGLRLCLMPVGTAMSLKEIEIGNFHRAIKPAVLRTALVTAFIGTPAVAHDNGQFGDVPPQVREWFHNVRSAKGIPCCDIADGHRTDFDMRQNLYWVPINGNWTPVPPDAVLKDTGNPTGGAVVWYSNYGGQVIIRCFVPGDGA